MLNLVKSCHILGQLKLAHTHTHTRTQTHMHTHTHTTTLHAHTHHHTTRTHTHHTCPQGSCCSPGLWNIQYNSLLNLKFAKHTSAIAFADDLILVTRGKTVIEAENFTNTELNKIATWAKTIRLNSMITNQQPC